MTCHNEGSVSCKPSHCFDFVQSGPNSMSTVSHCSGHASLNTDLKPVLPVQSRQRSGTEHQLLARNAGNVFRVFFFASQIKQKALPRTAGVLQKRFACKSCNNPPPGKCKPSCLRCITGKGVLRMLAEAKLMHYTFYHGS